MAEFILIKLDEEDYSDDEYENLQHALGDLGLHITFAKNVVELVKAAGFEVEEDALEQYNAAKEFERKTSERFDAYRNNMRYGDIEHTKARAMIDIAEALTLMIGFSR